jgi:hypothetical protein
MTTTTHASECDCRACQGRRWFVQLGLKSTLAEPNKEPQRHRAPRVESLRLDLGDAAFNSRKPGPREG